VDQQTDARGAPVRFRHYTYRVTSDGGLETGSQIRIEFDPEYEKIDLNFLRRIRGGRTTDVAPTARIDVIRQEKDLERQLYNGRLTALVVLDDVRVGDVVDYAVTRTGANPVFGGRFTDSFPATWTVPIRHERVRFVVQASRDIRTRETPGTNLSRIEARKGPDIERLWEGRDIPEVTVDPDTPSWFEPFGSIEISEFSDWASVVDWALPLYSAEDEPGSALASEVDGIYAGCRDDEERALAALDFVQRKVRYLGIEMGAGSYRPHAPGDVLARRFGDCKDKARLLCAMLRRAGIDACPALVSVRLRRAVAAHVPTPLDFDHVIAKIVVAGRVFWVDPTASYQSGGLASRGAADFGPALVIAPGVRGLEAVGAGRESQPFVRSREVLVAGAIGGQADLSVSTRYLGQAAESMRAYLAQASSEDLSRSLANSYSRLYPGIVPAEPPKWADDGKTGEILLSEHYSIPGLWQPKAGTPLYVAATWPMRLRRFLQQPGSPRRTAPFALEFPANYEITTEVHLPRRWNLKKEFKTVRDPAFEFSEGVRSDGDIATVDYFWTSRADSVPPGGMAEYSADIKKATEMAGLELSLDPALAAAADSASVHRPAVFLAIGTLIACLFGAWRVHAWRPAIPVPTAAPPPVGDYRYSGMAVERGIGGWLVVLGFVIVLRLLALAGWQLSHFHNLIDERVWIAFTAPGRPQYRPLMGFLLAFETASNVILLVSLGLAAVLYFERRRPFSAVMIGHLAFTSAFAIADAVAADLSGLRLPAAAHQGEAQAAASCIFSACWIAYLLVSRRVRTTFC
jgi:transglutaminase-like putative cysteine protease